MRVRAKKKMHITRKLYNIKTFELIFNGKGQSRKFAVVVKENAFEHFYTDRYKLFEKIKYFIMDYCLLGID